MKTTDFALLINTFLTEYLTSTRNVSSNTILSYRDTIVLLITFVSEKHSIKPERLKIEHLSPEMVREFLEWLEQNRKCSISTRTNGWQQSIHFSDMLEGFSQYICSRHSRYMQFQQKKHHKKLLNILIFHR